MRTDLALLRSKQAELAGIIDALELQLVDDPRWGEPSDTSYLSARDRADPDIMANVEAMTATNMLIDWFGRDMEGFVGFWRGPEGLPAETAPVVRLDTEGQYALIATTVGDFLLVSADHDDFASNHAALVVAGFTVQPSVDEIYNQIHDADAPNVYRNRIYNEAKSTPR